MHKIRRVPLSKLNHVPSRAGGVSAPAMTVRVGCRLVYQTIQPTPIFLIVRPRPENSDQIIL